MKKAFKLTTANNIEIVIAKTCFLALFFNIDLYNICFYHRHNTLPM